VSAAQGEIGVLVVELLSAQFHDVRRSAEVFGVTPATLRSLDARQSTMKSVLRTDVRGDLLVAIEAQPRLTIAIAAVVALRALLLVFLVSSAQLAWHEQGLRIHRLTTPDGQQT
jgi:hypothetical protein